MSDLVPIRRALISVSDKADLVTFAQGLADLDVEIVSTGAPAAALAEAGLRPIAVESVTGFPEMMGGRVKTLHPAIHGAVLARRDVDGDRKALQEHDIHPIDLVCVNLYPFERTIRAENVTPPEAFEQIDIGGPALVRAAAKNHRFVTVLTSPGQYEEVLGELRANRGATSIELRRRLAAAAFARTAAYDAAISRWMCTRSEEPLPALLDVRLTRDRELRYGENPHQEAALYADGASAGPSVVRARVLHGRPLSYNNVQDAAAALDLVVDLQRSFPDRASAAIIKHTNACGAAVAGTPAEAFERAYASDPAAAYGGILAIGRVVDEAAARRIGDGPKFLEVIVAPDFEGPALELLRDRWANVRLIAVGSVEHRGDRAIDYRSIPGGALAQERDSKLTDPHTWRHATGPAPSERLLRDALFVWTIAKHLKSNAIAIGHEGRLLGAGSGQVDRVTACRNAIEKAGARLREAPAAIAASDAFFPFPDGPKLLIDAGVKCLVHPGGSIRDAETIDLCKERGVTCLLTGLRHFRH